MPTFGMMLKTYRGDLAYAERLIVSYTTYNADAIPLFIVVPQFDLEAFEKFKSKNITLFSDESITTHLVSDDSVRGIRPGYVNQEIIKLAFWEKKVCENYLCLDSDGEFIRDFFVSDFMYDSKTPYTILVEDNELKVEPEYYRTHWQGREKSIRKIQETISLTDKRMLTCHGFAILSAKVLESLYKNFMVPRQLTYRDLLKISPYEFSWYNMWLQKDKTIPLYQKEPIFKYFHHKNHHLDYLRKGITLTDIARGYVGIVINSNYSRGYGIVSYDDGEGYLLSFNEITTHSRNIVRSIFLMLYKKMKIYTVKFMFLIHLKKAKKNDAN